MAAKKGTDVDVTEAQDAPVEELDFSGEAEPTETKPKPKQKREPKPVTDLASAEAAYRRAQHRSERADASYKSAEEYAGKMAQEKADAHAVLQKYIQELQATL